MSIEAFFGAVVPREAAPTEFFKRVNDPDNDYPDAKLAKDLFLASGTEEDWNIPRAAVTGFLKKLEFGPDSRINNLPEIATYTVAAGGKEHVIAYRCNTAEQYQVEIARGNEGYFAGIFIYEMDSCVPPNDDLCKTLPEQFSIKVPKNKGGVDEDIAVVAKMEEAGLFDEGEVLNACITENPRGKVKRFICMEWCDGSLSQAVDQLVGRLSQVNAAKLAYAAFQDALHIYARTNLIDIDFKPDNFVYSTRMRGDRRLMSVLACDFGGFYDYGTTESAKLVAQHNSPLDQWYGGKWRKRPKKRIGTKEVQILNATRVADWSHVAFAIAMSILSMTEFPTDQSYHTEVEINQATLYALKVLVAETGAEQSDRKNPTEWLALYNELASEFDAPFKALLDALIDRPAFERWGTSFERTHEITWEIIEQAFASYFEAKAYSPPDYPVQHAVAGLPEPMNVDAAAAALVLAEALAGGDEEEAEAEALAEEEEAAAAVAQTSEGAPGDILSPNDPAWFRDGPVKVVGCTTSSNQQTDAAWALCYHGGDGGLTIDEVRTTLMLHAGGEDDGSDDFVRGKGKGSRIMTPYTSKNTGKELITQINKQIGSTSVQSKHWSFLREEWRTADVRSDGRVVFIDPSKKNAVKVLGRPYYDPNPPHRLVGYTDSKRNDNSLYHLGLVQWNGGRGKDSRFRWKKPRPDESEERANEWQESSPDAVLMIGRKYYLKSKTRLGIEKDEEAEEAADEAEEEDEELPPPPPPPRTKRAAETPVEVQEQEESGQDLGWKPEFAAPGDEPVEQARNAWTARTDALKKAMKGIPPSLSCHCECGCECEMTATQYQNWYVAGRSSDRIYIPDPAKPKAKDFTTEHADGSVLLPAVESNSVGWFVVCPRCHESIKSNGYARCSRTRGNSRAHANPTC